MECDMLGSSRWKKEEIDFLRASYPVLPVEEIAEKLGCTKGCVYANASRFNCKGKLRGKKPGLFGIIEARKKEAGFVEEE